MATTAKRREIDESLAIRAAWLHYAGGLTQAEVAERIGVSPVKAHRLVNWAAQNGAVKVSVVGEIADCARLEAQLTGRFGLRGCEVVPDLGEPGLPLRALGPAGAAFLQREIAQHPGGVIGIGHGRTLAAAVESMPPFDAMGSRFVSLLGGLARNYAANPHDVMHRLAGRSGAEAYVLPLPFFANSSADRDVLLAQSGVREVFDMAAQADLMLVGIGTTEPDAQLVASRMIRAEEIREVTRGGAVGEILGHFLDAEGRPVATGLSARTVAPALEVLRSRRVVALAGGPDKVAAIAAVLRGGWLDGLITDEATAQALAALPD
ncbi:sugar-binding transcriptional regulator [Limimaricola litoreus]